MGSNTESLIVELGAKVDEYNAAIQGAMDKTKSGSKEGAAGLKHVEDRAVSLNQLGSKALLKFAGIAASAFATDKIMEYADAYTSLQNRIRTVIDPTQDLAEVTKQLLDLSNESRGSIDATAELYSKLKRNTKELGLSQEDLLGVTGTINKAFAVSGASSQEASGSIRQLAQALASGALRGDEFNSVAEGAPAIMEAIMMSTGKTAGQLRELAADGKISADILIQSLQAYSGVIDNDFSKAQMTAAQAQETLNNNFTVFVGELDKATGFSAGTAENILALSSSLALMQPAILGIIDGFKDFSSVVKSNSGLVTDMGAGIGDLAKDYELELAFMGELVGAFAWLVKSYFLAIPKVVGAEIAIVLASFDALIDGSRIKILEFRQFIAEKMGDDSTVAIIEGQIAKIGTASADILDATIEASKARISNFANFAAEFDASMDAAKLARIEEQNAAEIQLLKDRLAREAEVKAEFEAKGGGKLELGGDGETPEEKAKREEQELAESRKKMKGTLDKAQKENEQRDDKAKKASDLIMKDKMSLAQTMASAEGNLADKSFAGIKAKATSSIMAYAAEGAQKAISQLGVYGIPVAAGILAGGSALSQKISGLGMGDSGSLSVPFGSSGSTAEPTPSLTTTPIPTETSTLDVSFAGDTGTSARQIVIMAPPGDSLSGMMAEWLNEGLKKGRIG